MKRHRYYHESARLPIPDDGRQNDRASRWKGMAVPLSAAQDIPADWHLTRKPRDREQAGVLAGKLQYGTAFGGSKVRARLSGRVRSSSVY